MRDFDSVAIALCNGIFYRPTVRVPVVKFAHLTVRRIFCPVFIPFLL
jgi:hypothetical protein